jgi:protocatechuate 3,4-dioxygenase, beta subunit
MMSKVFAYRRHDPATQPFSLYEPYRATVLRSPRKPLILLPHTLSEVTGPVFGPDAVTPGDGDLTRQHSGEALGERIIVSGRVLDDNGRPVPHTLIEIWQANAAGRYRHDRDNHPAPLDPNFSGAGRVLTDHDGYYSFTTVKPGAYPWKNHANAWRPAHIHLSLFGPAFATRLVTQMYFPGEPLNAHDRLINSVPDAAARERLVCRVVDNPLAPVPALGFAFDIVLRGRAGTPWIDA